MRTLLILAIVCVSVALVTSAPRGGQRGGGRRRGGQGDGERGGNKPEGAEGGDGQGKYRKNSIN